MEKTGKEKRLMVHVYLTDEEKKRIEEKAKKFGISVSSYIKVKLFMKDDR
jgi:ACT domain-containing protein